MVFVEQFFTYQVILDLISLRDQSFPASITWEISTHGIVNDDWYKPNLI